MRPRTPQSVGGFTLIEIAIVVAVMTILLTLGLSLMNAQLSSTAYSVTKKRQEAIKDALIAYLGAHKHLPCPYGPITPGMTINGVAPSQQGNPPACPESFGVVPFATLGLSRETGEDGWGNLFSYQVYADTSAPPCPSTKQDWGNAGCFGAGKAIAPAISVVDNTNADSPRPLTPNAIAVIISHGANGLGAWAAQATPNALPVSCEERKNANGDLSGCSLPLGDYFKGERQNQDDVVAWVGGIEAINMLAKQGTIKSAIAQVNDDLQILVDRAIGIKRAGIALDPSSPPSPIGCNTSVKNSDPNNKSLKDLDEIFDPWGEQYVVGEGSTNKLPICICSKGGGPTNCSESCSLPPSPNPPFIKNIDRDLFNSYLAKAGLSGC